MRRIFVALLIAFCVSLTSVNAQQVVIDPSQIAASATNAANQIDYMLDQLGELAHLGDQMNTMREHIDNVFGEDGIGGKAISVMQDLGTLARLTESYNSTIKMTEAYARQMQEMERYKLSDANMMLSYLNSMKTQIELAVETAKKILSTMGFSKAEKKEEIEKIIDKVLKAAVNPLLFDDCKVAIMENCTIDWYRKDTGVSKMRVALAETLCKFFNNDRFVAKRHAMQLVDKIISEIEAFWKE